MSTQQKASEHNVIVRLAVPDDAEAISRVLKDGFTPFAAVYTAEAFAYTTPDAETIRARFNEGPIWVATDNGAIVGTVAGLPESERFYIRSMAVSPASQGLGVGQKLLESLEAFASDLGYKRLYLYSNNELKSAIRLYERNGFRFIRETPPEEFYGTSGVEMEKILD